MARARLSVLFRDIRGKLGDVVIRRHKNGYRLALRPMPTALPPTEATLKRRSRFKEALAWMQHTLKDGTARAFYDALAEKRGDRVNDLLKSDYLVSPTVDRVDVSKYSGMSGDQIRIKASDNISVARVFVQVVSEDGEVLEEGDAEDTYRGWRYRAVTTVAKGSTVRIVATAFDRPGGKHTVEVDAEI